MSAIHYHYDQLTIAEKDALDEAFSELTRSLRASKIKFDGNDQTERAVDAMALAIINRRT